jgi:hypothetical protein
VACYSYSGISGTKTEPCIGNCDYWVLKLDADGNKIWDKTIGGTDYDLPSSITISTDNELLISGSSNSNITGNKTEDSFGSFDFWIVSLDTNGNLNWQKTIGGSEDDGCENIFEITNNNYMLLGYSNSGISGLKTDACRGQQDYWMVEIANDFGLSNFSETKVQVYPNPTTNFINFETAVNRLKLQVYNMSGQLLTDRQLKTGSYTLDVSNYPQGIFFYRLTDADKYIKSGKFVKE